MRLCQLDPALRSGPDHHPLRVRLIPDSRLPFVGLPVDNQHLLFLLYESATWTAQGAETITATGSFKLVLSSHVTAVDPLETAGETAHDQSCEANALH